jgi:hypothetical protein
MSTNQKMAMLAKRLLASLVDLAIIAGSGSLVLSILWAAASISGVFFVASSGGAKFPDSAGVMFYVFIYGSFAVGAGWFAHFWINKLMRTGATPGKQLFGLVLVGQHPGFWRYLSRELVKYLPLTVQVLAWAAGPLGIGLPNQGVPKSVVFVSAVALYFIMPFVWIALFILSTGGRFPHDTLFGTDVTTKTPAPPIETDKPIDG